MTYRGEYDSRLPQAPEVEGYNDLVIAEELPEGLTSPVCPLESSMDLPLLLLISLVVMG